MNTVTITREKAQRAVSQLAKGIPATQVAQRVGIPTAAVQQLRATYGPDLGTLATAAADLAGHPAPLSIPDKPGRAVDDVDALLAEAAAIGDLAKPYAAAMAAIDELRAALVRRKAAQRAQVEARAIDEEIARLDQTRRELEARKAALLGHQINAGPDPALVRKWARDHDIPCPASGRVPRSVVEAYQKAKP